MASRLMLQSWNNLFLNKRFWINGAILFLPLKNIRPHCQHRNGTTQLHFGVGVTSAGGHSPGVKHLELPSPISDSSSPGWKKEVPVTVKPFLALKRMSVATLEAVECPLREQRVGAPAGRGLRGPGH